VITSGCAATRLSLHEVDRRTAATTKRDLIKAKLPLRTITTSFYRMHRVAKLDELLKAVAPGRDLLVGQSRAA
jgi:hypothetical protein